MTSFHENIYKISEPNISYEFLGFFQLNSDIVS